MQRCQNPACPFRLRHGFGAEFEDRVARCRSCGGELEPERASPAPNPRPPASHALARLGMTLALVAALVGLGQQRVSTYELDIIDSCLVPALRWLIGAGLAVELGARAWARGRPLASRRARTRLMLLIAIAGLVTEAWIAGQGHDPSAIPEALARLAGLPVLLGLAAIDERWGLGQGVGVVLGAVMLDALLDTLVHARDPSALAELGLGGRLAIIALMIGGALALTSHPVRAGASGRTPRPPTDDRDDDAGPRELGLGLTTPSAGIVALLIVLATLALLPRTLITPTPAIQMLMLAVLLGLTAAFAWASSRPEALLARWRRAFPRADPAALTREAELLFRRGLIRSELLAVLLVLLVREGFPAIEALVLTAIILDLGHELRARVREGELVAVETELDVPGTDALALALALEQRPALVQGRQLRALLQVFAPWLRSRLLVAPSHVERTKTLVSAADERDHSNSTSTSSPSSSNS